MKIIFLVLIGASIASPQLRPPGGSGGGVPSTSTKFAGTVVNDATAGDAAWTNPSNATTENGIVSSCDLSGFPAGETQVLESSNFGFSIPVGSSIDGILVEWKASTTTTDGADGANSIQSAAKGGSYSFVADGGGNTSTLTASLTYYSAGGATDKWGTTWTVSNINASNFGFYVRMTDNGDVLGNLYQVDAMRVTIYYTTAGGGSSRSTTLGKIINGLRTP